MPFVFYDTETTGLSPEFDQILQVAAIRTDDVLNIVDPEEDQINLRCRRLPHIVPSPGALGVNRIGPDVLETAPLTHYQMVRAMVTKLRAWGSCVFVGYNSLGFDEIVLSQTLYQTLHPMDLTSAAGSYRADVMAIARAAAVYGAGAVAVPRDPDGRLRFGLRGIAHENRIDLPEAAAHDAFNDVRATLEVARLLRKKVPIIWRLMLRNANDALIKDFISQTEYFHLTTFRRPEVNSDVVVSIGEDRQHQSNIAVFNLAYDPAQYVKLTEEQIATSLRQTPDSIQIIRLDSQPIVMPYSVKPDKLRGERHDDDIYHARALMVRENSEFSQRVWRVLRANEGQAAARLTVEQRIFERVVSVSDDELRTLFHGIPWADRPALCERFEDDRLRELGRRIIYFERPDVLPLADRSWFADWIDKRIGTVVPWRTAQAALQELDDVRRGTPQVTRDQLDEIMKYIIALAPKEGGRRE